MKVLSKEIFTKYWIYWCLQFTLPLLSFLAPEYLSFEKKIYILLGTSLLTLLVVLPINIAVQLFKENKRISYVRQIYKAVTEYYLHYEFIRDEYHRITKRICNFRIVGSDAFGETIIRGFNNHPEGKVSKEMKLFIAGDSYSEGFEFKIHDNLRNIDLQPIPILVEESLILYKIEFYPLGPGENFDFTVCRQWKGCIVKREEYIFLGFKHEIRGTELCEGKIIFDRQPLTYYETTLKKAGEIASTNLIELKNIGKTNEGYELAFKINNPRDIYIINFVLQKNLFPNKVSEIKAKEHQ